jgi:hypothetical protein
LIDVSESKRQETDQYLSPVYASGNTFSSGMLDTLVCQAFYNPHIITIVQSLVSGSDANEESEWNKAIGAKLGEAM